MYILTWRVIELPVARRTPSRADSDVVDSYGRVRQRHESVRTVGGASPQTDHGTTPADPEVLVGATVQHATPVGSVTGPLLGFTQTALSITPAAYYDLVQRTAVTVIRHQGQVCVIAGSHFESDVALAGAGDAVPTDGVIAVRVGRVEHSSVAS